MSSAGINPYLDPADYNKQQAIKRKQLLAQSLLEQGQSDPGPAPYGGLRTAGNAILGALLSKQADKDMAASNPGAGLGQNLSSSDPAVRQKAYQTALLLGIDPKPFQDQQAQAAQPRLMQNMQPQINDVQSTPTVTQQNPANSLMRQAIQNAPIQSAPSLQDALSATGSPELTAQLGPQLIQQQMERGNQTFTNQLGRDTKQWENMLPMSEADKQQLAAQGQQAQQNALFENRLPATAYQRAELANQQAQMNKPVSVGFGDTLVSPSTGKIVYGGGQSTGGQVATGADGQPLSGDALLATLPAGLRAQVKQIGDYRSAPLTSMALRSPMGSQIASAVAQYNPTYDASQYGSKVKARNDFATGKNGNTVRSLNVAVQHLDLLGQLATSLGNGDVQAFNRLGQFVSQQTGKPAPTNFDAAKQIVGDEVVKAVVGTGGGVSDREEASKAISRASSPQQLAGVIQTYQGLMGGQLSGLKQQYEKTTGLKDFDSYLAPETQAKLQQHGGGGNKNGSVIIRYDTQGNRIP